MVKTALAFADENNESTNTASHNLGPIEIVMAEKLKSSDFAQPAPRDIDGNLNTIISTQAYRRAKAICRQMALEDPATILKGIAKLSFADQKSLVYLKKAARRMDEINRRNQAA